MSVPSTFLQMFSTITEAGELTLELLEKPMPVPQGNQVLIKIEATPINPSDQGVMFGRADISAALTSGSGNKTVLTAPVPNEGMPAMKARVGQALAVGNEGAGTVVATGDSELAKSLAGKTVAVMGGSMYAQYRCVDAATCLPLLDGHTAKDGASCFVNPLTALSMIETMKMEGHTALVHTAAASNILTCMEAAAARTPGAYSIYGSVKHKQVYLYGNLDVSATKLQRAYGMAWGVSGWLLPNFLAKAGMEVAMRLRARVYLFIHSFKVNNNLVALMVGPSRVNNQ
jgi:hypothetical protein